ncbi:MAG: hypothetical protein J5I62_11835 [Flavobacteriales bacterium]|nr:hypothetical protein [Flavobacteriales bacterium]MEB2341594.1 hypothetical protein [Flavobacteriia bacterium]
MADIKEEELASILKGEGAVIQELYAILEQEEKEDAIVRAVIRSTFHEEINPATGLAPHRLFSREVIRRTCIKYRLRFLPSGRFKGPIPSQAVTAVRHLEKRTGMPAKGFMILAPAGRFKLSDCDADPMLFVPVGEDLYYLVHRWGRDMHPLRAVTAWPVRNWPQFVATSFVAALLIGALIPTAWVAAKADASWWGSYRLGAFFCTAMLVGAITSYCWWAFFGQFSRDAWDSKTFN